MSTAVLFERRRAARERRAARRAPFVAAVKSAVPGGRAVELALAMDLSESGIRLRRCAAEPVAPLVRLEFELPDGGAPIVAAGRLLSDEKAGAFHATGVRFIGMSEDEQRRIARYVAAQTPIV